MGDGHFNEDTTCVFWDFGIAQQTIVTSVDPNPKKSKTFGDKTKSIATDRFQLLRRACFLGRYNHWSAHGHYKIITLV